MDEKPVYDTTDIPILPLPFDPQAESNYKIALPSRYNDDGTNVVLSFPADVPMQEAVTEIRNSFKRNSADTQWQMMLPPGDQFHLDVPATLDDFKQWKTEKDIYSEGYNTDLTDLLIDGGIDFLKGIYSSGKQIVGLSSSDEKEMGRHAFNVLESTLRGVENFSGLLGLATVFAKKQGLKMVNSLDADQADYDAYTYMKGMAKQMAARATGDLITEGGSPGMFGQLPGGDQLLAAVQKDPNVPAASPEDIKDINNAAIVLDPSWLLGSPGFKSLEQVGAKMAANSIAKHFLPSVLATEVAPKMAFGALAKGGQALDYITRGIFNAISGIVEGVSQGSVTDASKAAANALARSTVYGAAFGGAPLIKSAIAGKAARAIGEIGLASLEGIERGSARLAVQELSENMATSAAVRASARAVLKVMPPDSAFNAMKGVANAAMHSGMFMGGIGAMQADLAGDDPVRGFEEGFASGLGMGAIVGTAMAPAAAEQANLARVARYFQDDSVGRSRERMFTATGPDGTQINVPINDMQGRVDLFNRTDIPLQEREMILAITRAHEKAGGEVFFHDGSEQTRNGLREAGLDAGKGFQIVDSADGRSIIVLDVNASDFSAATAAEEVFHGMFTDATAKEVWKSIGDDLGTQDATAIAGALSDFGTKYISALEAAPGGAAHAEKLREILATGTAPGLSDQDRVAILTPIINEYAANYVGAALAGMKPAKINQPQINNIWDKAWDKVTSNILSTFDKSRMGITKDPVTGHFFDSGGKRIKAPAMEHIVERFVDAAREGKASIDPQNTVDGATYFDVRPIGSVSSVEDIVDGKQTTKTKKQEILAGWAADTIAAAYAIDGTAPVIVTPEVRDAGYIHANLPKDGTTVFFQRVMPDALVDHISRQVVNGRRVFEDPRIPKQWNDAVAAKRIITLDSWHNISKTMGDRTDSYYARANRWVLPLGTQQMPKGGIEGTYLDISRLWSNTQELMKASAATKQAFKEKGINSIEQFIPLIQQYFDNFSSPNPVPTAELPGFTPQIRNAISKSLDLKQRKGELAAKDAARFKNDNGFDSSFFYNLPRKEVDIGGGKGTMGRESVTLASVRLDRINGISEFTLNGDPVTIRYNDQVPNLARANFSPGKTQTEQLGDSLVVTDNESGKRMIISANNKTKLFDGDKITIHNSPEEAEARANKNSAAQVKFSPKGEEEFRPKAGDEVIASIRGVDTPVRIMSVYKSQQGGRWYAVDIPGSELVAETNIYPKSKAPTVIPKELLAEVQQTALDPRSTTASLVDKAEKLYASGVITRKDADAFKATVKSPEAQNTKTRKKVRQVALNQLAEAVGVPELAEPVQLEFELKPGGPDPLAALMENLSPEEGARLRAKFEELKQEPMPGAEERVSKAAKKIQDERLMSVAKVPSSMTRNPERFGDIFREVLSVPRKKVDAQVVDKLTRTNPLVRREEIAIQQDTRTEAQRKRHAAQMLALAKRENVLRYRETQRIEKLEARLDALQAKQRKSASADRAKEMKRLLDERDRLSAETESMIRAEREAAMRREAMGAAMEARARRARTTERAATMEQLLRERDAQMLQPELTTAQPEPQPESLPQVSREVVSPVESVRIFQTPSGKFRVALSSGTVIGISDEYKKAVKLAEKYAAKTFKN